MSTTVVDEEFGTRLRLIMQQFGSVADLARAVGVSDNAIYKWVTGRGKPGMSSLVNLARAAGVSVEWLATGKGQPLKSRAEISPKIPTEFVATPGNSTPEPSVKAGSSNAGSYNAKISPQIVDYLSFKPEWLKRIFDLEAEGLALIEVVGDSMSPTIDDGDLVLADTRELRFKSDGIYVIRSGEDLSVKRIQREPDGRLTVRSDNQAYHTTTVATDGLSLFGRVVWISGRV
jgi:phage repressor protein C with HTH and peptisase S24 domain